MITTGQQCPICGKGPVAHITGKCPLANRYICINCHGHLFKREEKS